MSEKQARQIIIFVFLIFLSFALRFSVEIYQNHGFFDDEAVYYMMAYSIAFDGDIVYGKEDLLRLSRNYGGLPQGIFLKKTKKGIFFAKSYAYPLVAAPFVRLFKNKGFFILAALLLLMDLMIIFKISRKKFSPKIALIISLSVMFLSVMWGYSFWISSEFFNFSLGMLILYWGLEKKEFKYPVFAAILLGLLTFSKLTNALFALPLVGVRFFSFRWKEILKSVLLGIVFVTSVGGFFLLEKAHTGEWNYMGGERRSFYYHFPYESKNVTFDKGHLMSTEDYWERFYLTPRVFLLNLYYFFTGRFAGLLIYFLPALLLLIAFRGGELRPWILFVSILIGIFSSIALMPDNFIGGGGCLGNRYFPNLYPLFIFLIPSVREWFRKPLWIAPFFLYPLYLAPILSSAFPATIGKMGFRDFFPVELTQINSIPTNINPHAFRVPYGKIFIYHLDDNFCGRQGKYILLKGNSKAEMVLALPLETQKLRFWLRGNGLVTFEFQGLKRKFLLSGEKSFELPVREATRLKTVKLVQLRIKSGFAREVIKKRTSSFCGAWFRIEAF